MKKISMFLITILITFIGINVAFAADSEIIINDGTFRSAECADCNITTATINVEDDKVTINFTTTDPTRPNGSILIDSGHSEGTYQKIQAQGIKIEIPSTVLTAVTLQGKYNGSLKTGDNNTVALTLNVADTAKVELKGGKYQAITSSTGELTITDGEYNGLTLNGGKATIKGGTFKQADYAFVNNGGELYLNGGEIEKLLLKSTNSSAKTYTSVIYASTIDYAPEVTPSHTGKFIDLSSGELTLSNDIAFFNSNNSSCGIVISSGATMNVNNSSVISTDTKICNSGTINYGEANKALTTTNPRTLAYALENSGTNSVVNFNNGIIYLETPIDESSTEGAAKIVVSNENYILRRSDRALDGGLPVRAYYLEDQTKWIKFKEYFTEETIQEVFEQTAIIRAFSGITTDTIDVSVLDNGQSLTIDLEINQPKSASDSTQETYYISATLTYEDGVVKYSDDLDRDTELTADNNKAFEIRNFLSTLVVVQELTALSDMYNYDLDEVTDYLSDNAGKLTIAKDGIDFRVKEMSYTDTSEDGSYSFSTDTVTKCELDILNGIKTLPTGSETPENPGGGGGTTPGSGEDVDVDGSTGTGVGIPIAATILLAGTAYVIRTKSNKKLFKI